MGGGGKQKAELTLGRRVNSSSIIKGGKKSMMEVCRSEGWCIFARCTLWSEWDHMLNVTGRLWGGESDRQEGLYSHRKQEIGLTDAHVWTLVLLNRINDPFEVVIMDLQWNSNHFLKNLVQFFLNFMSKYCRACGFILQFFKLLVVCQVLSSCRPIYFLLSTQLFLLKQ